MGLHRRTKSNGGTKQKRIAKQAKSAANPESLQKDYRGLLAESRRVSGTSLKSVQSQIKKFRKRLDRLADQILAAYSNDLKFQIAGLIRTAIKLRDLSWTGNHYNQDWSECVACATGDYELQGILPLFILSDEKIDYYEKWIQSVLAGTDEKEYSWAFARK